MLKAYISHIENNQNLGFLRAVHVINSRFDSWNTEDRLEKVCLLTPEKFLNMESMDRESPGRLL